TVPVIVALATLAAIGFSVYLSLDPNNYFFHWPGDREKWVYHPGSVAFVCAFMLAAAALTLLALVSHRPRALWLRCLLALAFLGPWALFSTRFVVHMPAYTLFHHLWVWLLVAVLLLVAVGSATRQLYRGLRGRPPNNRMQAAVGGLGDDGPARR